MRRRKHRKPRGGKDKAQRHHARKRLLGRYGIELTKELRDDMISQISNGKARFVERQSRRLSLHIVRVNEDIEVPAVYDSNRKEIVTFLYPEWVEEEDK